MLSEGWMGPTKRGRDYEKAILGLLGNPCRLKILLALARHREELSVYKIAKFSGLGRASVTRHLPMLVERGLVRRRTYGRISLYSLPDGPLTKGLLALFREAGFL
ncbi:MAG: helix-turn-helix domain-containing protein [Candidatus Bathyarchaeia archaeon]